MLHTFFFLTLRLFCLAFPVVAPSPGSPRPPPCKYEKKNLGTSLHHVLDLPATCLDMPEPAPPPTTTTPTRLAPAPALLLTCVAFLPYQSLH